MALSTKLSRKTMLSLQLLGLGMLLLTIYLTGWRDFSMSQLLPVFIVGLLLSTILPAVNSSHDKEQ
jgi:uncharacterized membrane protein YadS